MYGAGSIGRGLIGPLFCESGYQTVFIDVNLGLVNALNACGEYPVYVTKGDHYAETIVRNVSGADGKDFETVAEEISFADIVAVSVGVNTLRYIAVPFANAVKKMAENGREEPLNVLVCENMIGAEKYFRQLVSSQLMPEEKKFFDSSVGFVAAAVGRMIPITPKEYAEKNLLSVCVEEYCELPVDKDEFVGEIPAIAHLSPHGSFSFYEKRNLYVHNMSYVLCAYLGYIKGYRYIWQAVEDTAIRTIAQNAMNDISEALTREYHIPIQELWEYTDDLLTRFGNHLLGDTVERVGRDTKRKLSESDRLIGAALLCQKHGIMPNNICAGIAAALMFDPAGDSLSGQVVSSVNTFGLDSTLADYCGIDAASEIALEVKMIYEKLKAGGMPEDIGTLLCR